VLKKTIVEKTEDSLRNPEIHEPYNIKERRSTFNSNKITQNPLLGICLPEKP
jgi:hypothetical protein